MRPRFSLRTLFVVMTLIAALFGWRGYNHQRAAKVAKLITAGNDVAAAEYGADPDAFAKYLKQIRGVDRPIDAKVTTRNRWHDWWLPSVRLVITEPSFHKTVHSGGYRQRASGMQATVGKNGMEVTVAINPSVASDSAPRVRWLKANPSP